MTLSVASSLVVAAMSAVTAIPPETATRKMRLVPERWRSMAESWTKTDDEQTTKKWGLEVALLKRGMDVVRRTSRSLTLAALTPSTLDSRHLQYLFGGDKERAAASAGDLLKRYGPAYLLTSCSFAAVSYAACYIAVARGVNVAALLTRFGMQATAASEKVGTASIAVSADTRIERPHQPSARWHAALTPCVRAPFEPRSTSVTRPRRRYASRRRSPSRPSSRAASLADATCNACAARSCARALPRLWRTLSGRLSRDLRCRPSHTAQPRPVVQGGHRGCAAGSGVIAAARVRGGSLKRGYSS